LVEADGKVKKYRDMTSPCEKFCVPLERLDHNVIFSLSRRVSKTDVQYMV